MAYRHSKLLFFLMKQTFLLKEKKVLCLGKHNNMQTRGKFAKVFLLKFK